MNKLLKRQMQKQIPSIKSVLKSVDGITKNYVINLPSTKTKVNDIIEARYVRRKPNYISAYLSSHTGCKMGCSFCWLTATGQTTFRHVDINTYGYQLDTVLKNVSEDDNEIDMNKIDKNKIRVNMNFMSRGDCMANKYLVNTYTELYDHLQQITNANGYGDIKMNISSIYPNTLKHHKLTNIFKNRPVNFYYSIYSLDNDWRKVNMPNSMDPYYALSELRDLQENHPDNTVVFHCAFIKGQNDSIESVQNLANIIKSFDFPRTKFNLVRYNPPPMSETQEADIDRLNDIFDIMNEVVTNKVDTQCSRIIQKVGPDVYASCGMFFKDIDAALENLNEEINEI
jgi:adenine C2-methylase RlmN of 23S rRNA A2503 and tRNA A37